MTNPAITSIFTLSLDEKLQLVQDLWDNIATQAAATNLPPDVITEVNHRRESLQQNPQSATTLNDILQRIQTTSGHKDTT